MVLAQKQKYRSMEQDRKPRNKSMHLWVHLIFDKRDKNIQWIKDSLFNKLCWENWTTICKSMKLEHSLTPWTKINSKWIKDLNVRSDTIKLLVENIGRTLYDINQSKILYDPPPRLTEIKTKGNKWDLFKLKAFAQQRKPFTREKENPQNGRKYLQIKELKMD